MKPNCVYNEIPYDWDGTDAVVLRQFDAWRGANPEARIIGASGPARVRLSGPDGWLVELTVLYE